MTRVRAPIIRPTESDHAERSTSEAVFCVVSSTAEKLIAQQRLKPDL